MSGDNPRDDDPGFAAFLEDLAHRSVGEGEYQWAEYLFDISDQWNPPTESERLLRRKLWDRALEADLAREAAA